jgi:hypothetical protein
VLPETVDLVSPLSFLSAEPVVRGLPAATLGVEAADRRVAINDSLGIGRE